MSTNDGAFGVSLADCSEVVSNLSSDDRDEYAGLGALVDWELVKFMTRAGWSLLRLSFTYKADEVLLVVKVRVDDTQYVVFVTRESPISCMRTLVRKLREKTLALYPDKYA